MSAFCVVPLLVTVIRPFVEETDHVQIGAVPAPEAVKHRVTRFCTSGDLVFPRRARADCGERIDRGASACRDRVRHRNDAVLIFEHGVASDRCHAREMSGAQVRVTDVGRDVHGAVCWDRKVASERAAR